MEDTVLLVFEGPIVLAVIMVMTDHEHQIAVGVTASPLTLNVGHKIDYHYDGHHFYKSQMTPELIRIF
jgi:hypothetical protein